MLTLSLLYGNILDPSKYNYLIESINIVLLF
jgi:hypothetical protein